MYRPGRALCVLGLLLVPAVALGTPSGAMDPNPVAAGPEAGLEAGTADWRRVSAGGTHTCGIRTNGRLYCWGSDQFGQLGTFGFNINNPTPALVAGNFTDWAGVSVGEEHTCARRTNNFLYCWGRDNFGQLGTPGVNTDLSVPTRITGFQWTTVSAGARHTCGRRTNGRLFCWGNDNEGALGTAGPPVSRPVPTKVGSATNWATVSVGGAHTCARRTTGRLFCWGSDFAGQLGDNAALVNRHSPTQVAGGATNWAVVSAGGTHTCATRTNGRLFCWGPDINGVLGTPGAADRPTPAQVGGGATNWATVSAGGAHTCARRTTGRLFCWGNDTFGVLGTPDDAQQPTPVQVAGGATDWRALDVGDEHSCARKANRRLYCWGLNDAGKLGIPPGPPPIRPTPVEVAP